MRGHLICKFCSSVLAFWFLCISINTAKNWVANWFLILNLSLSKVSLLSQSFIVLVHSDTFDPWISWSSSNTEGSCSMAFILRGLGAACAACAGMPPLPPPLPPLSSPSLSLPPPSLPRFDEGRFVEGILQGNDAFTWMIWVVWRVWAEVGSHARWDSGWCFWCLKNRINSYVLGGVVCVFYCGRGVCTWCWRCKRMDDSCWLCNSPFKGHL